METDTSSNIPDGFVKIIRDFLNDILNTFPEYKDNLEDTLKNILLPAPNDKKVKKLFKQKRDSIKELYQCLLAIGLPQEDIYRKNHRLSGAGFSKQ